MFIWLVCNPRHINTNTYVCLQYARPNMHFPWGFLCTSVGKETACNAADLDLISRSGRSPGERSNNPLQCSCLGNPMDTTKQLNHEHSLDYFFPPENFPKFSCTWLVNNLSSSTGIYTLRGKNDSQV